MGKKLKIGIIFLTVVIGLFLINNSLQNNYSAKLSTFLNLDKNNILKIVISSNQEAIELMKIDSSWVIYDYNEEISGNDTFMVKNDVIDNLFIKIAELEKQHLVTSKKENWNQYGVTDNIGTHLAFINLEGITAAYYVFGKSQEEYNKCYARTEQESDVYLLNSNILYQLQVNPNFWGTKIATE